MKVRSVITPALIKKAFARTGIYPFNPNVFSDQDFAPSKASSRDAHLPSSYPPGVGSPQTSTPVTTAPQLEPQMGHEDDVDANLDLEGRDVGCIEMDNGAIDESEGSDPDEDDGESNNLTFYYDPSLDGPQNASPDRDVAANTLRSSTIGVPNSTDFLSGSSRLPENETITPSANPPECNEPEVAATGQESMIPEPTHVSDGPGTLFTGPLIPLPSVSQFSQMNEAERWTHMHRLHLENRALTMTVAAKVAEAEAANAHCTLAKYEISTLRQQQASKKGNGRTMKMASRFITHPDLKDAFEAQQKAREEKAAKDAEIAAKKKAEHESRTSRIDHDVVLKTFENSLSTYKRKDDLVTIARALQITVEPKDTITTLLKNIKARMAENPALAQNPRFSALFGEARRGQRKRTAATLLGPEDQCITTPSQTQQAGPSRVAAPSTVYAQPFTLPVPNGSEQPPQLLLQPPHITQSHPYHEQFYPPTSSANSSHSSPPYEHPTHVPQPYIFASSTYSYTQPNSHSFDTAH